MFPITQVTSDPFQTRTLTLPDGSAIQLTLKFVSMQFGWFIPTLTYKSFVLQGLRVTNSPNMLHQFRNQIPFGLACYSTNNREPSQQQDFSSGASILYVLSSQEVKDYAEFLSG